MELTLSLSSADRTPPPFLIEHLAKAHTEEDKRRFLISFWVWANGAFFDDKMKLPRFLVKMPQEAETDPQNPQGMWFPSSRHLYVGEHHFAKGWAAVYTVTLHEMCHQAVTEIDRKEERAVNGHGPRWAKWMKHCNLPVNKIMWLRDPDAKLSKTQMKNWDASNNILNSTQSNRMPAQKLKVGTPVRFLDRAQFKLHNEVYVGKVKHEGVMSWVLVGEADIGTNLVTYHPAEFSLFEAAFTPSTNLVKYAKKIQKYMGL